MTRIMPIFSVVYASFLLASLVSTRAAATLGEKAETVETVRQSLSATRHQDVSGPRFTVHEVASAGITLRGTTLAQTASSLESPGKE